MAIDWEKLDLESRIHRAQEVADEAVTNQRQAARAIRTEFSESISEVVERLEAVEKRLEALETKVQNKKSVAQESAIRL